MTASSSTATGSWEPSPMRICARVLLLSPDDRVLLVHATDPEVLGLRWRELPGGGREGGETLQETACRELAEETGFLLHPSQLGEHLWTREARHRHRRAAGPAHETVFLARTTTTVAQQTPTLTDDEQASLLDPRWWHRAEFIRSDELFVPRILANLVADIISGDFHGPLTLVG